MINVLDKSTPLQVLLNVIIFFLLSLILYNTYQKGKKMNGGEKFLVMFLILLFCLFPYWGNDYWHYMADFLYIKRGDYSTNLEEIYNTIIHDYMPSYFIFRLIVWGLSIFILYTLFKNEKITFETASFIFVITFLPLFSYARATFPMVLMYMGVSLLYSNKLNRVLRVILGIGFVALSIPFHKSALFGVSIIAVCTLMTLITKKTRYLYLILLLSIPFIINYIQDNVDIFLEYMGSSESIAMQVGQQYLESDESRLGIAMVIYQFLQRVPFVIIMLLYVMLQKNKYMEKFPLSVQSFANIAFLELFVSFLFLFVNVGLNFSSISYRFSYFAWIPSIVLIAYCIKEKVYPVIVNTCLITAFISAGYSVVYAWYNAF